MFDWKRLADGALEAPVVTSFSRVGYDIRSRLGNWRDISLYDLSGRTVVVTGATSGLGRCMAQTLARCGASVVLWGRSETKTNGVRDDIARSTGSTSLDVVVADMAEPEAVRRGAAELMARHVRVDAAIHNAGALSPTRTTNSVGHETTVASQVLGPFLLTTLLLDRLRASAPSRVITMSSGGMYASALRVEDLEMGADYRGAEQYARAKRAQVTLNEMWAERNRGSGVAFHAVHPGWADTPGVQDALPAFRRVMRPVLRTVEQGSDTALWLAADDGKPLATSGLFWHDREPRAIHKLPTTRRSDTPERRQALWDWCTAQIAPFLH